MTRTVLAGWGMVTAVGEFPGFRRIIGLILSSTTKFLPLVAKSPSDKPAFYGSGLFSGLNGMGIMLP